MSGDELLQHTIKLRELLDERGKQIALLTVALRRAHAKLNEGIQNLTPHGLAVHDIIEAALPKTEDTK